MVLTLVQNIALLVALSVVHQWVVRRWRQWTTARQVVSGLLFGAITVVGMMTPFRAATGIQYDGRSIIVAVAGIFGGPVVAGVAAAIAAAYRIYLGGAGAPAGVAVIAEAALLGVAFHYLRRRYPATNEWLPLYGVALAVHVVMLALQYTMLGSLGPSIVASIWFPVIGLYPVGMLLVCRLMLDQGQRQSDEDALRDLNESLERKVEARTDDLQAANEQLAAASEALTATNQRLVESDAAKSQFLRAMSHELRTPLNSVIGFSNLLHRGYAGQVNEEQQRQLDMINRSGRRLLAIINDILDLSRIEAGAVQVSREEFDVGTMARDIAGTLLPEAEAKSIALLVELPDGEVSMYSDQQKVGQILLNLVANAVKFTERGSVTVRVRRPSDGMIAIDVADTGPGVADELRDRIFTEFVQEDERVEGTGLGLAISRGLAELLGGTITLDTAVGTGSTFSLLLPGDSR